jgi:cytochrome c oxidase subunit 3
MSEAHAHAPPRHPYHLVAPSIWPLLGAVGAGLITTGGVLYMHGYGWTLLIIGILSVLAIMAVWWRDVIREATFQGYHTPVVQLGLRYGMALFIASEVMFFAAFFWAFFASSLFPVGGVWPPKTIHPFDQFEFPFLNTLILLLSGTTVTWAHHSLIEGDRSGLIRGLALTIFLGICFTSVQAYEYSHAPFHFTDGIYPSTFFMATGFHGFHVIIGTTFLIVCFCRAWAGHFKPDHHFGFEAALGIGILSTSCGCSCLSACIGGARAAAAPALPDDRLPHCLAVSRRPRLPLPALRQGQIIRRAAECAAELRYLWPRSFRPGRGRRSSCLRNLFPRPDRRRPRRARRDSLCAADLGASRVVDAADPGRRGRNAATAQGGPDRFAISPPPSRRASLLLR